MPATPKQAVVAAVRESNAPSADYTGLCLRAVRTWLDVPAKWPNARTAWEQAPAGDRRRGIAQPGMPLFWRIGKHWHVALCVGPGICASTDILQRGRIGIVPIGAVEQRWGAELLGFCTSLNGVRLRS